MRHCLVVQEADDAQSQRSQTEVTARAGQCGKSKKTPYLYSTCQKLSCGLSLVFVLECKIKVGKAFICQQYLFKTCFACFCLQTKMPCKAQFCRKNQKFALSRIGEKKISNNLKFFLTTKNRSRLSKVFLELILSDILEYSNLVEY